MYFKRSHIHTLEVEFEELDWGGRVHHPHFLKYLERARGRALEGVGFPYRGLMEKRLGFVVAEVMCAFRGALKLGDSIQVTTETQAVRRSSMRVFQTIQKWEEPGGWSEPVFEAHLRLVCVSLESDRPLAIPLELRQALEIPDETHFRMHPQDSDVRLVRSIP